MQHLLWTRDHCDISDSSNVITIRFYSGCSGKCITLVSTVSSLVTFKTTSLNWMPLVMRQLILVWSIFRSNPRHLMVIIQCTVNVRWHTATTFVDLLSAANFPRCHLFQVIRPLLLKPVFGSCCDPSLYYLVTFSFKHMIPVRRWSLLPNPWRVSF